MRRISLSLLAVASVATAAADRAVIEDSSDGATSEFSLVPATPTFRVVWDNSGTTTLKPHTCAASACTRAVPSGDTEGMRLDGIGSWYFRACLSTGTFTGTGAFEVHGHDPSGATSQKWGYLVGKDQVPKASVGVCQNFPTFKNSAASTEARVAIRSNAVGVSTAAPVLTLYLYGCKRSSGCHTAMNLPLKAPPTWDDRSEPPRWARAMPPGSALGRYPLRPPPRTSWEMIRRMTGGWL